MSRVTAFFFVIMVASSLCFAKQGTQKEIASQELLQRQHREAKKLYQKAFRASFAGDWKTAERASIRAARLENGSSRWHFEAPDLIYHQ